MPPHGKIGAVSDSRPTLWHIEISHYSEKARWALAWKGIEHRRVAPVPGAHMLVAAWLSRGRSVTFPILTMDGRNIADSTRIVAALEQRYPDPPLYPRDPGQRQRALDLEDYFDEELGPYVRLVGWHELGADSERLAAVIRRTAPAPMARVSGAAARYARLYTSLRFGARDAAAAERVLVGLDRLEAELEREPGDYLVGDSFTVADLTAASLLYPLVIPAEGPLPADEPLPEGFQRFRQPLEERPGFKWVAEMFRRHRKPAGSAAPTAAAGAA
jgi:glutathione S-transferase